MKFYYEVSIAVLVYRNMNLLSEQKRCVNKLTYIIYVFLNILKKTKS